METIQMTICKRVGGVVTNNNGEFAAVDMFGIEGIEEGFFLDTMQIHCCDSEDASEKFQQRFPVGMELRICATFEISPFVATGSAEEEVGTTLH
jgi:hypothetical protein